MQVQKEQPSLHLLIVWKELSPGKCLTAHVQAASAA